MTLTNQNLIQEEIKSRLKSVQNFLSSNLLTHKKKVYRTITLPVVLYACETWLLILRDESSLRVSENRVLRRIFGPKRDEVTGEYRKLHKKELNDLYYSPNSIWVIKSRRVRWPGHVTLGGRGEVHTGFWWGNLRERAHWRPRCRYEDNINMDLQKWDGGRGWTGLIWLRIGTGSRLL
jgi:hypothetical protein